MFGEAIRTVQQVRTTLDQLAAEDFAAASDCDLHAFVAEAVAAVSRLQAVVTAAVGEWDTRMLWAHDGATSGQVAAGPRRHGAHQADGGDLACLARSRPRHRAGV